MFYIINDRIKFDKKKTFTDFFRKEADGGETPTVGLFTVYLRTVLRTPKKTLQKFSLLERFFWPVQRPNPRNNSPFVIENTARKSIPLSVIARKNLIHLSLRGAKRRSNPEKERWYTGLLRFARNDGYRQILFTIFCKNFCNVRTFY